MNIMLVGEVKWKSEFFRKPCGWRQVSIHSWWYDAILGIAWEVSGEDFVDIIAGHKEELARGAENQGIGFKVATITILKN